MNTPSCIGSQFLWFNNYITIDNSSVHLKEFSSHNIKFINQLFISEREFTDWHHMKREFQLIDNLFYKYTQISHAIPKNWKQIQLHSDNSNTQTKKNCSNYQMFNLLTNDPKIPRSSLCDGGWIQKWLKITK